MKKSDVANITGGVQTEDGRTLYGMDAEVYKKMKAKEDPEWERKLGEWIEDVVEHEIEDTSDLYKSLKSGVILCELVNKIKSGIIKKYNNKSNLHVLMERENIELYLDACNRLGMDKSYLFATADLHSRRSMSAVLQNLQALSKLPRFDAYLTGITRSVSVPVVTKKKKWDLEYQTQPIYSEQLKDDLPGQIRETQQKLQEALLKISKLEDSNTALKTDLKLAREKLRGLAKGGGSLRLALGRIIDFFWWFGGQLLRWGRIWVSNKYGLGIFIVVFIYTTWRLFYRTRPSSIPTNLKATTTIHQPRGEDKSRFFGFFRGIFGLLLE